MSTARKSPVNRGPDRSERGDERLNRPQLIRRRLETPALPQHFVARPRVRKLLSTAVGQNKVCVVSAAAGSGKTSALVDVCLNVARRVAWLTVDRPDTAPGRLLTYLQAALAEQVPSAAHVVSDALGAGAPHLEAAGLLAEAVGDEPTLIVIDELERLGRGSEAWDVIEALVRYAPQQTAIILSGREDMPPSVLAARQPAMVTFVDEAELAFTVDEAGEALLQSGRAGIDASAAVSSTGGWVAGVLFHESPDHPVGGRTHAFREYLAADVIGRLPDDLQEFAVTTCVLGQVTVGRAEQFGYTDAQCVFAAMRPLHLPVVWAADEQGFTWHSAIREYLAELLMARGVDEVRRVRLCHARVLAAERLHEEAVEAYLLAGERAECVASASRALTPVVRRLDFDVAERWLHELADFHDPGLTIGRLLIALAHDDLNRAVMIADRARRQGVEQLGTTRSRQAAFLMTWCYLHHARWDDAAACMDQLPPGPSWDTMQAAVDVLGGPHADQRQQGPPAPADGMSEVIINMRRYGRGELTQLTHDSDFGWDASVRRPWQIAARAALGHTQEALRDYRAIEEMSTGRVALLSFVGPDLLMDAGAHDDAETTIATAIRLAGLSGSLIFQGEARLAEVKFLLRVRKDPEAALRSLQAPELQRSIAALQRMRESAATWRGLALLRVERDAEALVNLRVAVDSMTDSGRILMLPTAAVYLAEAEWRAGQEDASDRAADLALDAAGRQGSNHLLLQAIDDIPAMLTRRLDAETASGSVWHELGRARIARLQRGQALERVAVRLSEFGRRELTVDGELVKLPIGKSYELLSFLLTRPGDRISRETLLSVLFDHRQDASSRSYLRQTIRWLKTGMPEGMLVVDAETVTLAEASEITSDASELARRLAEAAGLQGVQRLEATLAAIEIYERGAYLPGIRSNWGDERERELTDLVTEARSQVAGTAIDAARLDLAIKLARQVLAEDPGRESAWQIVMRAAEAQGDQDGVTRAFRECEGVLAGLGMSPTPTTRGLLDQLRR